MNIQGLLNIKKAVSTLNPKEVRQQSERRPHVALYAPTAQAYEEMEDFFLRELSPGRRSESALSISREPHPATALSYDLSVYDSHLVAPSHGLVFDSQSS